MNPTEFELHHVYLDNGKRYISSTPEQMIGWIEENYISKKQIRKHFEKLHGGGNARRLVSQLLDENA